MATIIGGVGTSHVPAIGRAIALGLQDDPDWRAFFAGYGPVRAWLAEVRPHVAVIFYNDHGLNFFLDKLPTFAVGAASRYDCADEGWGLPVGPAAPGDPALSWQVIETLVGRDFDPTTCQELLIDHAVTIPLQLLWPDGAAPLRIVPIAINTVQHPLPSARRCFALGQAVRAGIESFPSQDRVVLIGSGGLSHQLDGARAGFLNPAFDRLCLQTLADAPEALTNLSTMDLVEAAGTQGVELLNWIAMRGALSAPRVVCQRYYVPVSNTGTGLLVLADGAVADAAAA